MKPTKFSDVDWSEHPFGLVSDSFIAKVVGCSDVTVSDARRKANIEAGPRAATAGIGKTPWSWRPWLMAWGEERVLAYLTAHRPDLVAVFEKHRPDVFVGISLDERAERSRARHEHAEAVKAGLREKRKKSDKPRKNQSPRTGEALRRWKLGITLTPEERKANSLENLRKAQEANAKLREEIKEAKKLVLTAVRSDSAAITKLAAVKPKPPPTIGRPTVRKPEKRQKPQLMPKVKATRTLKVVDPESLKRDVVAELERTASTIEEFIRRHGVKVLAPAGSGKNVGQLVAVRRA